MNSGQAMRARQRRVLRIRPILTLTSAVLLALIIAFWLRSCWPVWISLTTSNSSIDLWLMAGSVVVNFEEEQGKSRPGGWTIRTMPYGGLGINILPGWWSSLYPRHTQIVIPLIYPAMLLAVLPILWILPFRRRHVRRLVGRCERCGYRLKGLRERRCPECGKVF